MEPEEEGREAEEGNGNGNEYHARARQGRGRRRYDNAGWAFMRHPLIQKFIAAFFGAVVSGGTWVLHERARALGEVHQMAVEQIVIKHELEFVKAAALDQRNDVQHKIDAIDTKVDRLDRRLTEWFERRR